MGSSLDPLLSGLARVLFLTEEVIVWDTALVNQEPTLEEEIVTTATADQIITIRPTTTTVTTHNQNRYEIQKIKLYTKMFVSVLVLLLLKKLRQPLRRLQREEGDSRLQRGGGGQDGEGGEGLHPD